MALLLIRRWRLAVLRVQLDLAGRTPGVTTELTRYRGRSPDSLWTLRHPLEAFGLGSTSETPSTLRVPADLAAAVARSLATDFEDVSSLWLRLVPPYGYLGAVPWEESLLEMSDMQLLRVPDRLPVASDSGQGWSAAIAVSAAPGSTWAGAYVADLVDEVARAVPELLDVDIFADRGTVTQLHALGVPARQWVHLHKPEDARPVSEARTSRGVPQFRQRRRDSGLAASTAPGRVWADWIAAGLAKRAARALHVVLDSAWDGDRPMLALSTDPDKPADAENCTFVTADDVHVLADAIGAATLSFGSPPDNPADIAMRMIADDLGQRRPGPTLYSSLRRDPHGTALAQAYRFIAARSAGRIFPPHPSLFTYLQPERVQDPLQADWWAALRGGDEPGVQPPSDDPLPPAVLPDGYQVSPDADLSDFFAAADVVPSWVATSERYISSQLADLTRAAGSPETGGGDAQAYVRGAAEALAELQELVAKHVRPT
jgi:hypothetical protein